MWHLYFLFEFSLICLHLSNNIVSVLIAVCISGEELSGGPFLMNISLSRLFSSLSPSLCLHTHTCVSAPCVLFISVFSAYMRRGFLQKLFSEQDKYIITFISTQQFLFSNFTFWWIVAILNLQHLNLFSDKMIWCCCCLLQTCLLSRVLIILVCIETQLSYWWWLINSFLKNAILFSLEFGG